MRRLLANSLCHLDPRLRTTLTSLHLPLWRCVRLPCVVPYLRQTLAPRP